MANATGFQINRNRQRGEDRFNSKLTEDDVREIRASTESAEIIAAKFYITPGNVWHIRAGKSWKHVK